MSTPDDIADSIAENATSPKRVQVGNQSVEQHALPEQLAALEHLEGRAALSRSTLPIRFAKIRPGGAV